MASSKRDDKGDRGPNQTSTTTTVNTVRNEVTSTRNTSSSVRSDVNTVTSGGLVSTVDRVTTRPDNVAQSISTVERGDTYNGVNLVSRPTQPALTPPTAGIADPNVNASTRDQLRKSGFLKLDMAIPAIRDGLNHPEKRSPNRSDPQRPRDDKKLREFCKDRPKDNRPKQEPLRSGGGGGSRFVPWKGTKYGC